MKKMENEFRVWSLNNRFSSGLLEMYSPLLTRGEETSESAESLEKGQSEQEASGGRKSLLRSLNIYIEVRGFSCGIEQFGGPRVLRSSTSSTFPNISNTFFILSSTVQSINSFFQSIFVRAPQTHDEE